jgi:YggT family protein
MVGASAPVTPLFLLFLDVYTFVVLVSVVLSWLRLSPDNPVVRVVTALTEPALAPIRKVVPDVGGFDLSPMLLLLVLQLVKRLLGG